MEELRIKTFDVSHRVQEEAFSLQSEADSFLFLTSSRVPGNLTQSQECFPCLWWEMKAPASIPAAATFPRCCQWAGALLPASGGWFVAEHFWFVRDRRNQDVRSKRTTSRWVLKCWEHRMWFVFGTKCEDWEWRLVLCQVRDCSCCEVRAGRRGKAQELQVWWLLVHSTEEEKKIKRDKGKINVREMIVQESDIFDFLHGERNSWVLFVKATGRNLRLSGLQDWQCSRVVGKALPLCREMQQDLQSWSECGGPQGIHSWRVLASTTGSWI